MTTYKVTAKTGYQGYAEGEEFDADLTEDQERRAKERGSIRVVKRDDTKPKGKERSDG
jgi:hypothetical protein